MFNDPLPLKDLWKNQDIIPAHLRYHLHTVWKVLSCSLFHLHNTPMKYSRFTSKDIKNPEKVSDFPKIAQPLGSKTGIFLTRTSSALSTNNS